MKSRRIYIHSAGFTIIEIIIVLGIFVLVTVFGLFMSMDVYRGNSLHSEKNMVLSILHKSRSRAINNINQAPHGVRFETGRYILFQGSTYSAGASTNQEIKSSTKANITSPPLPYDIVFDQLSGNTICSPTCDLTLTGEGKSFSISINSLGRITWN